MALQPLILATRVAVLSAGEWNIYMLHERGKSHWLSLCRWQAKRRANRLDATADQMWDDIEKAVTKAEWLEADEREAYAMLFAARRANRARRQKVYES